MADFITLSCPVCTGQLKVTEDLNRFTCAYCGTEHIVRRTDSTVSLQPLVRGIREVQKGVDRTASELAIFRLEREIAGLEKGISATRAEYERHKDASHAAVQLIAVGAIVFAIGILGLFTYTWSGQLIFQGIGIVLLAYGGTRWQGHRNDLKTAIARETQLRSELKRLRSQYAHHYQIASN